MTTTLAPQTMVSTERRLRCMELAAWVLGSPSGAGVVEGLLAPAPPVTGAPVDAVERDGEVGV